MKRWIKMLMIVSVLVGFGANALAGIYYWHGQNGDQTSWGDALNWSTGVAPGAADGARIGNASWIGYPVTISTTTSVYDLYVGVTSADATLATVTITADADFTTTRADNYIGVSIGHSSNGKITSAGTVSLGVGSTVLGNGVNGNGELHITGGTWTTRWLTFGNTAVATNHVQIDVGTLMITGGMTGLNLTNQTIDITDGTLIIAGDKTGTVDWWKDLGNLTGYGDVAKIVANYDSGNNITTVTALSDPETPMDFYLSWVTGHGLIDTNGNAAMNADPDDDLFDNLAEYALGGNPTNSNDQGHVSEIDIIEEGGTNWMVYVHYELVDKAERGLTYTPEISTNLISTNWSNATLEWVGSGTASLDFNVASNRVLIATEDQQFVQLEIGFSE